MAEDHRFTVGLIAGGRYAAASIKTPRFLFVGLSKEEVESKAKRALDFYFEREETLGNVETVAKPLIPATRTRFLPLADAAA